MESSSQTTVYPLFYSPAAETRTYAPFLLATFFIVQVLDGLLTYWGVSRFGLGIEMNAWLAIPMEVFGPGPALLAAKGLACFCGCILYLTSYYRPLAITTAAYMALAIVPWFLVVALVA